jgi:pantoate--beta-alanine ligase
MADGGPDVVRTVAGLRSRIGAWRAEGCCIGFVPTMGALHEGHLSLMRASLRDCDRTVASIFVNPTQFGPNEDFDSYPRGEAEDLAKLAKLGADLVFAPDGAEMYADGFATTVMVSGITEGLCSVTRPHFFQGVATVVTKLLLQCLPDRAYFGEKDYQQLQVIRRLTRDLDIPVEIVGAPTVREPDGLAMSSRNAYLSREHRAVAPLLHETMRAVADTVAGGASVAGALTRGRDRLAEIGFDPVDYLEIRESDTLAPVVDAWDPHRPARVFAAAYLGETRLIDNIPIEPSKRRSQ